MYTQYVNNYASVSALLDKTLSDRKYEKFQKFCADAKADPRSGDLDLASFLIMPVQRIPRYKLLLVELEKALDEGSDSAKLISSSIEKISSVATCINEDVKFKQSREAIVKLQSKFVGKVTLVTPSRLLVHQGTLIKVNRKGQGQKYEFFLFSDLLIYASSAIGWRYVLQLEIPIDAAFDARDLSEFFENRFLVCLPSLSLTR